ncbi:MAG: NfeD family protein, partial [Desulfatiglandales bacterium]
KGERGVKILNRKTISTLIVIILFSLFNAEDNGYPEDTDGKRVYYTLLKGTINKRLASDFEGVLKEAERTNAEALILEIDTFGGRLDSAVKIKDRLIDTRIDTIAFINKKAISAGALISLATRHIVMAPGSTIGAATPVRLTYWEEKPASEKVISYFRKEMKSTAEANNHPGDIAEAMVDPDVKIEGVVEKGKLLTLTTKEALRLKVAEHEAKSLEELLSKFHLQGIEIEKRPIPWTEKVVDLVPSTFPLRDWHIWILLGIGLVIGEIFTAGFFILWFGVGAFLAAGLALLGAGSIYQMLSFILTSLILIVLSRTIFRQFLFRKEVGISTNVEALIGQEALVMQIIEGKSKPGLVKIGGETWSAISEEGRIDQDEVVRVKGVVGNKVLVERLKSK